MHAVAQPQAPHELARDEAFERLYRRYARDVYRYTLAVLRNPADAEDITQTTFLNAYRAYLRGEQPIRPRNWLIKIAHNACRTRHLRAVRRPQEVPLEETVAALRLPSEEAPKVEELLEALGRLPFNQRAALVMRELEGRSYVEIAQTLDVSVAAVETLIFRARRSLRKERSLLGALGAVQLPPSLSTLAGGGGGVAAVAGGGAVAGSGLFLKAVLVVAAGLVAGTVGTAVETRLDVRSQPTPAAVVEPAQPLVVRSAVVPGALGPRVRLETRVRRERSYPGKPVVRTRSSATPGTAAPALGPATGSTIQEVTAEAGAAQTATAPATAPTSDAPSASSGSSQPVTAPVTQVTSPVTSQAPAQPEVQAPPLPPVPPPPPLPVATPSVPETPAVPSTPALPATPTVPSVP